MDLQQITKKFRYDPVSGNLFYRSWYRSGKEQLVKSLDADGYLSVTLNRRRQRAHRVCYMIFHQQILGDKIVDHLDQDKKNNRISNLRLTTRAVNNQNLAKRKTNTSGVVGVYQIPSSGKWRAQIRVNKINKHIGCYNTIEEATAARRFAIKQYGFCENHA